MGIAHEAADLRDLLVERSLSGGIRTVRRAVTGVRAQDARRRP
ncbi:hypothetical protein ACFSTC_38345 [Nonomuraea ferruginea]